MNIMMWGDTTATWNTVL